MENTSSFYSIGLLAISLAKKAKEFKEAIQKNNAQKSIETQLPLAGLSCHPLHTTLDSTNLCLLAYGNLPSICRKHFYTGNKKPDKGMLNRLNRQPI